MGHFSNPKNVPYSLCGQYIQHKVRGGLGMIQVSCLNCKVHWGPSCDVALMSESKWLRDQKAPYGCQGQQLIGTAWNFGNQFLCSQWRLNPTTPCRIFFWKQGYFWKIIILSCLHENDILYICKGQATSFVYISTALFEHFLWPSKLELPNKPWLKVISSSTWQGLWQRLNYLVDILINWNP